MCQHGKRLRRCLPCSRVCGGEPHTFRCIACASLSSCDHSIKTQVCTRCRVPRSKFAATCEHARRLYDCKMCWQPKRCPHGTAKHMCRDCNGNVWCEHGNRRYTCKQCGGPGICPLHFTQKSNCRGCKNRSPPRQCQHGPRTRCAVCVNVMCPHNQLWSYCRACGGSDVGRGKPCEHLYRRERCKLCRAKPCFHGIPRYKCRKCKWKDICDHNRRQDRCGDCKIRRGESPAVRLRSIA